MLILSVATLLALVAAGAPASLVIASAVLTLGVAVLSQSRRERRRRERARRRLELAAAAQAERARRKAARKAARRAAILERTGLDVDLVAEALRDLVARASGHGSDAVKRAGERVTSTLAARYGQPARTAASASGGADTSSRGDAWLDLDADFDAMQSRRRTEHMLRLSDELSAAQQSARTRS